MNTYCPARPANSSMSRRTWSGVKATKSTTASPPVQYEQLDVTILSFPMGLR